MGVFKEIPRADGTGVTSFYRLDNVKATVETDSSNTTDTMIDYDSILNKPSINDVSLVGNKTSEELGLQPAGNYLTEVPEEYITAEELESKDYADKTYVQDAVNNIEHFHREIVEALPLTGEDTILYMVRKEGTNGDVYNEYIWTGTSYELIGTTAADLTVFYTKEEADKLLNKKVDKVKNKDLSTNDFTNAYRDKLDNLENYDDTDLQNKVNQLHNYDDTSIKTSISELESVTSDTREDVNTLQEQTIEKLEAVYLIKSGDAWLWQNRKGDNITFAEAQQLLEQEHYILIMEYLETDGKITPRQYISLDDRMIVYYIDQDNKLHALTLGTATEDNVLGYEGLYFKTITDKTQLPTTAIPGTIIITSNDENIYIHNGIKWIAANPNALIDLTQYLAKDNTVAYIPTGDYNPATKKYVDDSIKVLNVPTKISQLYNDLNFVPKDTTDLINYYTKVNLYNKTEIDYMFNSLRTEGKIHTYSWDSKTYEGNPNDIIAMQVLFDEYLNGEVYNLSLKLRDIKDNFNGLYGISEFAFDGTKGYLYMCSGDKTHTYGISDNVGSRIIDSNTIVDIEFEDRVGSYIVTSVTLRKTEDPVADYLSTTTMADVDYVPTLGGHPATKKYVDDTISSIPSSPSMTPGSFLLNKSNPDLEGLSEFLTRARGLYVKIISLNAGNNAYYEYISDAKIPTNTSGSGTIYTKPYLRKGDGAVADYYYYGSSRSTQSNSPTFLVTYSSDKITVNSVGSYFNGNRVTFDKYLDSYAICTNNSRAYTPTNEYNPATKKYVDDSITTALGDVNTILATLTTIDEEIK